MTKTSWTRPILYALLLNGILMAGEAGYLAYDKFLRKNSQIAQVQTIPTQVRIPNEEPSANQRTITTTLVPDTSGGKLRYVEAKKITNYTQPSPTIQTNSPQENLEKKVLEQAIKISLGEKVQPITPQPAKKQNDLYGCTAKANKQKSTRQPTCINVPSKNQTYGHLPNTRGVRNNNPGNIRYDGTKWKGLVGKDGGFCKFRTPEDGLRALGINLKVYHTKYGLDTIKELISRWAPSSENPTKNYIQYVAKETGINSNQEIDLHNKMIMVKLVDAIARYDAKAVYPKTVLEKSVNKVYHR